MNELRIVRGTDICLYADDEPLFGVTSFGAEEKPLYHEVYEYLNSKPCDRIPQGPEYEIRIGMMSLFGHQLPVGEEFALRLTDGGVTYRYGNCCVVGRRTKTEGSGIATEEFTVKADTMEKQVAEDE